jgi:hypothetical protein
VGIEHGAQGCREIVRREAAIRQVDRPLEAGKRHAIPRPARERQAIDPTIGGLRHVGRVKTPGVVTRRARVALQQPDAQAGLGIEQRQCDQAAVQTGAGDQHIE